MVLKTKRNTQNESSGKYAVGDNSPRLRWSVEQRLAFIDERLFWLGEVNRTDLVRRFGVSMSQASGDIGRYLTLAPPDVHYDKSAKRYAAGKKFRPVLTELSATRFLGELRLIDIGILHVADSALGTMPPFDATPVPERSVDPFVLRAVLLAIRERQALNVFYQSMSRPRATERVIEPHALAHDGFRWHTRAHDREAGEFRDFVLGRLSKPQEGGPAVSRPDDDGDWFGFVDLVIAPHPNLTPAQSQAIAIDYGIDDASISIRVRRALLFYALKRLGLDVPADARAPQEQHIVLLNRKEIEAVLIRRVET